MVDDLQKTLDTATRELAKAKALIEEGERIKERIKTTIMPIMESFNVEKSNLPGVGTLSLKHSGGSAIDKQKLTETLLLYGIDADCAAEIIEKATKTWSYSFLEFRRSGGKGEKN